MKPVIATVYVVSTAIKSITVKQKGYLFETDYDENIPIMIMFVSMFP